MDESRSRDQLLLTPLTVVAEIRACVHEDHGAYSRDQKAEQQAQPVEGESELEAESRHPGDDLVERLPAADLGLAPGEAGEHAQGIESQEPGRRVPKTPVDPRGERGQNEAEDDKL